MDENTTTKVLICLCFLIALVKVSKENLETDILTQMNSTQRSLSRRKRYLIFPEGSSLQLVFCLTVPTIGQSGRVLTIGGTAALAWELPSEPYDLKKKHGKNSDQDQKHHDDDNYFDHPSDERIDRPSSSTSGTWTSKKNSPSATSITYKKTHYNPFLFNKATSAAYSTIKGLLKRPTGHTNIRYNSRGASAKNSQTQRRKNDYHKEQATSRVFNEPVTTYLHPVYQQIHRRTRRDLYSKIEKLLKAQNKDGKACLLKAICEVTQAPSNLGSFMEEIIKAIFRAKPFDHYKDEDEYDRAANKNHNCTEIYPTCDSSVWNVI